MTAQAALLDGSPFNSYSYAYPHKTAYRRIEPAVPLGDAWRSERQDSLFLYLHVPFCEYRCGFCNLFTQAAPAAELPGRYLGQLRREAEVIPPNDDPFWTRMQAMWDAQTACGHVPRSVEEVEDRQRHMRDGWDERQEAIERLQEEGRLARRSEAVLQ